MRWQDATALHSPSVLRPIRRTISEGSRHSGRVLTPPQQRGFAPGVMKRKAEETWREVVVGKATRLDGTNMG
eukprot:4858966-Pyramimonas_sp.AAC.1